MKISVADTAQPTSFRPVDISIHLSSESELKALRAFFGGVSAHDVEVCIKKSATPSVGRIDARRFAEQMADILNDACTDREIETMETT